MIDNTMILKINKTIEREKIKVFKLREKRFKVENKIKNKHLKEDLEQLEYERWVIDGQRHSAQCDLEYFLSHPFDFNSFITRSGYNFENLPLEYREECVKGFERYCRKFNLFFETLSYDYDNSSPKYRLKPKCFSLMFFGIYSVACGIGAITGDIIAGINCFLGSGLILTGTSILGCKSAENMYVNYLKKIYKNTNLAKNLYDYDIQCTKARIESANKKYVCKLEEIEKYKDENKDDLILYDLIDETERCISDYFSKIRYLKLVKDNLDSEEMDEQTYPKCLKIIK